MDSEALANRPESPKKKVRSNPASESEAQPSDYSDSRRNAESNAHNSTGAGINGLAATRNFKTSSVPDSSSERSTQRPPQNQTSRVQEEEVSSSENSVLNAENNNASRIFAEGDADSISNEPEDLSSVCDSASSSSVAQR